MFVHSIIILSRSQQFQLAQAKIKSNWASGRLAISCTVYVLINRDSEYVAYILR